MIFSGAFVLIAMDYKGSAIDLDHESECDEEFPSEPPRSIHQATTAEGGEKDTPAPPDGGWGWVIVASCFLTNFLLTGLAHTFGIYIEEYTAHFHTGVASVSLSNSLLIGGFHIVGPIVAAFVIKWGCQKIGFVGSLLAAAAFITSAYSPNVIIFQLTYGVIGGFGFGMMYLPAIVAVGHYFDKKRALANGIAQCGSGMGVCSLAPLVKYLLTIMDWRATHYMRAGLLLQCCALFALMRPLRVKRRPTPKSDDSIVGSESVDPEKSLLEVEEASLCDTQKEERSEDQLAASVSMLYATNLGSSLNIPDQHLTLPTTVPPKMKPGPSCFKSLPKPVADVLTGIFNTKVLKSKTVAILCIGNCLGAIGFYVPVIFFSDRAVKIGISEEKAALLVSVMGGCGLIGRITPGLVILAIPKITPLLWNNISMIVGSLFMFATPWTFSFPSLVVAIAGISLTDVAFSSLAPVIICDLMGIEKLDCIFGLICFIRGISIIVGPPLAGLLYDLTASYDATFYMAGAFYVTGAALHMLLHCKTFQSQSKERTALPK